MVDKKKEKYDGGWGMRRTKADLSKQYDGEVERKNNNIYFYSYVTYSSVQRLVSLLDEIEKEILWAKSSKDSQSADSIKLYIHTYGGEVFSGLDAYNRLKASKVDVTTIVNGVCASAGSLLFLPGKERIMGKYSFFMIHQLSASMWGNYEMLKDDMINATKQMDAIKEIYKDNMKLSKDKIAKLLKRDLYLTSEECLKMGICTKVV